MSITESCLEEARRLIARGVAGLTAIECAMSRIPRSFERDEESKIYQHLSTTLFTEKVNDGNGDRFKIVAVRPVGSR